MTAACPILYTPIAPICAFCVFVMSMSVMDRDLVLAAAVRKSFHGHARMPCATTIPHQTNTSPMELPAASCSEFASVAIDV